MRVVEAEGTSAIWGRVRGMLFELHLVGPRVVTASASIQVEASLGMRPRVKRERLLGRPLHEQVADLEADVSRHEDRLSDLENVVPEVARRLESLPSTLAPVIERIADERRQATDGLKLSIRLWSVVRLLLGTALSTAGGIVGAVG